jgi:tRNA A-37 threonylcarbamoyl transferase component Bud32
MSDDVKPLEGPERLIGSRVLDFELKAILGSGGMSVVYRGQHRVTGQEVAIKILPPELAVHEELKARFVEEARVLAKLEHPNIVHLNNFTESGGRMCLVMQYVEGVTFESKIVSHGKVPAAEALRVTIEVCKGLEYAHSQGVIHRDIKPSNVLVRGDGAVKVTDFGIAKMMGNSRLTSTGQTMGTVRYMSPEQVRGKLADARSDLYSLGITLFEALCGTTPFDGENHFDIMQQHLRNKPPSLAKMGVALPGALEKALFKALEKNADDRYVDAAAFRQALEAVLPEVSSVVAQAATATGKKSRLAPALGLAVLVAGGAGATFLVARQLQMAAHSTKPTPITAAKPAAVKPATTPKPAAWLVPHAVAGETLAVDETFKADGVRVQSASRRDPAAVRDAYRGVLDELRAFLAASDIAAARTLAAHFSAPPLNLVIVPQALIDTPSLWPEFKLSANSTYASRYLPAKRTLFVNDSPGFVTHDLPYGVALHVLTPVQSLSNDDIYLLAEKFERDYNQRHPK